VYHALIEGNETAVPECKESLSSPDQQIKIKGRSSAQDQKAREDQSKKARVGRAQYQTGAGVRHAWERVVLGIHSWIHAAPYTVCFFV
jgi:hypothetical protein